MSEQIHSKMGEFLSTWQWLATEILSGKKYDETSDLYSFGIVCSEVLTRKLPFTEYKEFLQVSTEWTEFRCEKCKDSKCENTETCNFVQVTVQGRREEFKKREIIEAIISKDLRPTLPAECPPSLRHLIEKLWDSSPRKRISFKSCVACLANLLENVRNGGESDYWRFSEMKGMSFSEERNFLRRSKIQYEKKNFLAFKQRKDNQLI